MIFCCTGFSEIHKDYCRRFGFQKYGTFPGNMKYADGTYEDTDWMMLELKKKNCE